MSVHTKETHTFLMPDYYDHFSCKMGHCRSACCVGWPISISMQNYFDLLGMDCPKHLRDKLDCGLQIYDYPSQERYAYFAPDHNGNCPLRMKDGLCSLHAEMGEEYFPIFAACTLVVSELKMAFVSVPAPTAVKLYWSYCLQEKNRSPLLENN